MDYYICSPTLLGQCTDYNVEYRTEAIHFLIFCQFNFKLRTECNIRYNESIPIHYNTRNYIKYVWSVEKENLCFHELCKQHNEKEEDICQIATEDINAGIELLINTIPRAAATMSMKRASHKEINNRNGGTNNMIK